MKMRISHHDNSSSRFGWSVMMQASMTNGLIFLDKKSFARRGNSCNLLYYIILIKKFCRFLCKKQNVRQEIVHQPHGIFTFMI